MCERPKNWPTDLDIKRMRDGERQARQALMFGLATYMAAPWWKKWWMDFKADRRR